MQNDNSEIRFEKARKKLSNSLLNLDKSIKQKIQEVAFQNKMTNSNQDDEDGLYAKIDEQAATIEDLNLEINRLQQNLAETGVEIEFLREKNKMFAEKINLFRKQGSHLIEAIEKDLSNIEKTITNEEYDNAN